MGVRWLTALTKSADCPSRPRFADNLEYMSSAAAAGRSWEKLAWHWRSRAILFVLIGVAIIVTIVDYALISAALSRVQLCYNARQETAQVIETLVRQESSLRAYTSTRDRDYLKPYEEADGEAEVRLGALRRDVIQASVPGALPYLADVERIHEEWSVYVASPLIDDPTGPLAASRQETGELLFTTLANDISKLSGMLEAEALAQENDARLKITGAIAEVALLTIFFTAIVMRLQRKTRKIENRYFADIAEANENLNRAQHLAGVGNWTMDLLSGKIAWSDELRRIYGVSAHEIDDELLRSFDHPDDAPMVQRTIESAIGEQRS
jgi:PAS domain-containing protein